MPAETIACFAPTAATNANASVVIFLFMAELLQLGARASPTLKYRMIVVALEYCAATHQTTLQVRLMAS